MQNLILAAVANTNTPNAAFLQSIQSVQTYCNYMTNVSLTGDTSLNNILTSSKTNSSQWYNTIYPEYLNMPSTIASQGSTIDSGFNLLIQLAGQMQASPSSQVRQSINDAAFNLQKTVNNIQQQTQALATALNTFYNNLNGDIQNLNGSLNYIIGNINQLNAKLANLYGQLQHLKDATCPSSSEINACNQLIQQVQQQINVTNGDLNTFSVASQDAGNAITGLVFLAGYWNTVCADAQNCVNALTKLQTDADNILQLDLKANQQQWNALKQKYQGITTQLTKSIQSL